MSVFETSKHLCSWAGLTPQNQESAGKKKTTRIGRAGACLNGGSLTASNVRLRCREGLPKPLLVQCALAAGKSNQHPELKAKYPSLKKRRGGKKTVIAVARKLLTAIWHILSKREPFNIELCRKADKPPVTRVLTKEQAFALLRSKGFLIQDGEVPIPA